MTEDEDDDSPREPIGNRKTDKGLVGAATILASVALGFDIRTTNLSIYRTGELELKRQESIASSQADSCTQTSVNGEFDEDEDGPPPSAASTVELLPRVVPRRSSSPGYLRQTSWTSFDDNLTMRHENSPLVDGHGASHTTQPVDTAPSASHKGHRRTASADNNLSNLAHKRTPSDGSTPSFSSFPSSRWEGGSSADPWSSPDSDVSRLPNPPQAPPRKISIGKSLQKQQL